MQNDPVNFTDPSGLLPMAECGWDASCGWGGVGGGFWGGGFDINYRPMRGSSDIDLRQGERDEGIQDRRDQIAANEARRRGDQRTFWEIVARNPNLIVTVSVPFSLLAQDGDLRKFAEQLVNNIPGSRIDTRNGNLVVIFSGTYEETVAQLKKAGYYSGIRAFNPYDHPGGKEFRTSGSPGFHFMIPYPVYNETRQFVGERHRQWVMTSRTRAPTTTMATHLHIDPNNPVGGGFGGFIRHVRDFLFRPKK